MARGPFLGPDGLFNETGHAPQDSQPQPRHFGLSPGRGEVHAPESEVGKSVIFHKKVAQNPLFQFDHNN